MPLTWDGTSIVASETLEERDMYSMALGLLVSSSKEFSKLGIQTFKMNL